MTERPKIEPRDARGESVACGYYTIGCLTNTSPRSLKNWLEWRYRSSGHHLRPNGTYNDDLALMAQEAGFRMERRRVHQYLPVGKTPTVGQFMRFSRTNDNRYVIFCYKHWIGVRGILIYDSAEAKRPKSYRIKAIWELVKA